MLVFRVEWKETWGEFAGGIRAVETNSERYFNEQKSYLGICGIPL